MKKLPVVYCDRHRSIKNNEVLFHSNCCRKRVRVIFIVPCKNLVIMVQFPEEIICDKNFFVEKKICIVH